MQPSYLRVVVTTRCPLACSFCHMEGDPGTPGARGGLSLAELCALTEAGVRNGARKVKFLGGEPLARADLPEVVRHLRSLDVPDLDLSIITSASLPPERLQRLFDAGLNRANVSIHGWSPEAFARRGGKGLQHAWRAQTLAMLVASGRPVKLNYVWTGDEAELDDLAALLEWASHQPVVVNVLDDLGNAAMGARSVVDVLFRLRGESLERWTEPDPHSLPTTRFRWADGLVCEVKTERLGDVAPYATCQNCPKRTDCREGITALRLGHDGRLRPCMDRDDLGVPLLDVLRSSGSDAATQRWAAAVDTSFAPNPLHRLGAA